jgi:hypothetical protein
MGLDEKALEAGRKYKFKPPMRDGKTPVPVMITVEVNFRPSIPGPQKRGTGGTLSVDWRSHRDRRHPPGDQWGCSQLKEMQ